MHLLSGMTFQRFGLKNRRLSVQSTVCVRNMDEKNILEFIYVTILPRLFLIKIKVNMPAERTLPNILPL